MVCELRDARNQLKPSAAIWAISESVHVCEAEAIRVMGLDPEDPDWEKVGGL